MKADKSPGSRKTGWENLRKRLKTATVHPMEDAGLFTFKHCTQFIRTFPALPRDERKTDDVDTNAEDHIGDAARYRALEVVTIIPGLLGLGSTKNSWI